MRKYTAGVRKSAHREREAVRNVFVYLICRHVWQTFFIDIDGDLTNAGKKEKDCWVAMVTFNGNTLLDFTDQHRWHTKRDIDCS